MYKNINLLSVSGKIGSGKDTVGKIIQHLTSGENSFGGMSTLDFVKQYENENVDTNFKIKKFADKLKNIVCLILGCTREQLEDQKFKNKELGEEWWFWKENITDKIIKSYNGYEINDYILVKLTPRLILQLIGTEGGRNLINPNIWVNSLFADYVHIDTNKKELIEISKKYGNKVVNDDWSDISIKDIRDRLPSYLYKQKSNWIITDMRFPNELDAVKQRGGIAIRVERRGNYGTAEEMRTGKVNYEPIKAVIDRITKPEHPSETGLDNATFDYVIDNNGTIEELIEKVKEILIKENIL